VLTARWLGMAPAAGARFALRAAGIGVLGLERTTEVLERWNV
jgi:probable phosphoglycerate mutase